MVSYYTLNYLMAELENYLNGAIIIKSLTPRRNVLEIYMENDNKRYRIVTDTGNKSLSIFLDQDRPEKRSNVLHFFEHIEHSQIIKLELAKNDRLIKIVLNNSEYLIFKLYSSKANIFHVRDSEVIGAFKNESAEIGNKAPVASPAILWRVPDERMNTKKKIQYINPLLPREWLNDIIEIHELKNKSTLELLEFVKRLTLDIQKNPSPRILEDGRFCLLPESVIPGAVKERFESVNEGLRAAYYRGISTKRYRESKDDIVNKLEGNLNGLKKKLKELQDADKNLERADLYEKTGHLLMANLHRTIEPRSEEIQVENIYQNNEPVTVTLKPDLDLPGNAQYYYGKAKKARKSYEVAQSRVSDVENQIKKFNQLLQELSQIRHNYELQKWVKQHQEEFENAGFSSGEGKLVHPFRKLKIGKYDLWVGKNAKSNDIIMSSAHKEDIWLHARGVSGSHVVIRMNNTKEYPSKEILTEAASVAAYYSKARGSAMAPVSYTKKKFVRKPKGTPPGLVYLDREEVVMVEPNVKN